ncbi:hypothetical protein D3C81_1501120 [compost metagenome]
MTSARVTDLHRSANAVEQERLTLVWAADGDLHTTTNTDVVVGVLVVNAAPHVELTYGVYVDACPTVVVRVEVVAQKPGDALVCKDKAGRHRVCAEVVAHNVFYADITRPAVEVNPGRFCRVCTVNHGHRRVAVRPYRALNICVALRRDLSRKRSSL